MTRPSHIFNVVASINLAYQTHAHLLSGILEYVKTHTVWTLNLIVGRRDEQKRFDPSTLDGSILYGKIPSWLNKADLCKTPTVMIEPIRKPKFPCCRVCCDNAPVAATAARHLLSKQCETYAFVHSAGRMWSDTRGRLFAEAIRSAGGRFLWRTSDRARLPDLIAAAPKPLGVFAATDILARATLDACRVAGSHVPDDVLILGVDNDVPLCELSSPTLSSIALDARDAGYRLAERLDRAMRGRIDLGRSPDIAYTGKEVVERFSTSRSFAYDQLVRRCLELLETDFASPIRVSALATRFGVSRRTLETHFRAVTGTTIAEKVTRLRIDRAKHLLKASKVSLERVATACGFYNASHLSAAFLRCVGIRPSVFRNSL